MCYISHVMLHVIFHMCPGVCCTLACIHADYIVDTLSLLSLWLLVTIRFKAEVSVRRHCFKCSNISRAEGGQIFLNFVTVLFYPCSSIDTEKNVWSYSISLGACLAYP